VLAAYTIVVGILLGAQGYYGDFQRNNPAAYEALSRALTPRGCAN
jgi:hypothetical protein